MKRLFVTITLVFVSFILLSAQNYGYLDTQVILEKMPEFKSAQDQLDRLKETYDTYIKQETNKVEALFKKYQSEKAMLSESLRQARENEIILKERAVKERQMEIFGQDGTFAKKSMELMEPIQMKVQNAIDLVARELGLMMIFDTSVMQGVVYKSASGDVTNLVLQKLNL